MPQGLLQTSSDTLPFTFLPICQFLFSHQSDQTIKSAISTLPQGPGPRFHHSPLPIYLIPNSHIYINTLATALSQISISSIQLLCKNPATHTQTKSVRKMVRAPCCEKMGLKKGPWTPQEDHILTTYINQNGHGNWRALPKQAGLMRCGKSCRLRWMNYLRPDIKRGNFTTNEEETIIQLHQELGNKWSVIAARLPGRTDNEIKNVWNTHLKKRLLNNGHYPTVPVPMPISVPYTEAAPEPRSPLPDPKAGEFDYNWGTNSPAQSISEVSSASAAASASEDFSDVCATAGFLERWSEDFRAAEWSGFTSGDSVGEYGNWGSSELGLEIGNEFWNGLLLKNHSAEDFIELPEIW